MHVDYKLTLRRLTDSLLQTDASYQQMFEAAHELYRLLSAAAWMHPDDPKNRTDIYLPEGKAIAPAWAAMCIKDFYRTRQFLRGMVSAIQTMQPEVTDGPVHVVYAGTGPFATLAMPLTTVFSPDEVQFTLLEINPESVRMLRNVLKVFQAEAYVRKIELTDATTYQATQPIHIVVTETMQQALQDEPQVAITRNLAPQLAPGGVLIPQKVSISAGLFNINNLLEINTSSPAYRLLCPVYELSARSAETTAPYPEVLVDIPENFEAGFSQFCLFTEIQVFESIYLYLSESGLTQPKILMQAGPGGKFGAQKVGIRYVLQKKPGFEIRLLASLNPPK